MLRRRRSPRLPAAVAEHVSGDVLAAAELADDGWAVVTRDALVIVPADGSAISSPWHEIVHGTWSGEAGTFTVAWVDGARDPLVVRVADEEPLDFTAAIRERVQSSMVHVAGEDLPSGAHVRVLIRRDAGGQLLSQVTVMGELTGDDAERVRIYEIERKARADVGLPD